MTLPMLIWTQFLREPLHVLILDLAVAEAQQVLASILSALPKWKTLDFSSIFPRRLMFSTIEDCSLGEVLLHIPVT